MKKFQTKKVTISVLELLKQARPAHHLESMVLMRYNQTDICALPHPEKYKEKW